MALLLKREEIVDELKHLGLFDGQENIFYGVLAPASSYQYTWIVVNNLGVTFVDINSLGKLTGDVTYIEKKDIRGFQSKRWLFGIGYKLFITDIYGQKIKFLINKKVLGHRTQKEEFLKAMDLYTSAIM